MNANYVILCIKKIAIFFTFFVTNQSNSWIYWMFKQYRNNQILICLDYFCVHKPMFCKSRRGSLALPHNPPKREVEHPSQFASMLRKDPLGSSTGSLKKETVSSRPWGSKRDLLGGSMSALNAKSYLHVPGQMRRNSRNYSTDSLDGKRSSWDPGRRGSSGSSVGWEEPIWEDNLKVRMRKGR